MTLWEFLDEGNIPVGWEEFFEMEEVRKELWKISEHISKVETIVYPMIEHVFRAFIPLEDIKVMILGQDPYHNGSNRRDGSAVGLCFSVKQGNSLNPSLRNIYKELKREGFSPKENGDLFYWKDQGCFMINSALTVEFSYPESHSEIWEEFTSLVIKYIIEHAKGIAWLLMGKYAQSYNKYITKDHVVFFTSHPSPFSYNKATKNAPAFLGSGVFQSINNVIDVPIKW